MYNYWRRLGQVSRSDDRHTDARFADLADLVLTIARVVNIDSHQDPDVVDLTAIEINVMRYVDRHPGTSPSAVAVATGLQRSNLSRVLRDLEAKGMVARTTDESDGRQFCLKPTPLAAANLRRLRAKWSRLLNTIDVDLHNLDATLIMLAEIEAALLAATP